MFDESCCNETLVMNCVTLRHDEKVKLHFIATNKERIKPTPFYILIVIVRFHFLIRNQLVFPEVWNDAAIFQNHPVLLQYHLRHLDLIHQYAAIFPQ